MFAYAGKIYSETGDLRIFTDINAFSAEYCDKFGSYLGSFLAETVQLGDEGYHINMTSLKEAIEHTLSIASSLDMASFSKSLSNFHNLTFGKEFLMNRSSNLASSSLGYVHLQGCAKFFSSIIFSFFSAI